MQSGEATLRHAAAADIHLSRLTGCGINPSKKHQHLFRVDPTKSSTHFSLSSAPGRDGKQSVYHQENHTDFRFRMKSHIVSGRLILLLKGSERNRFVLFNSTLLLNFLKTDTVSVLENKIECILPEVLKTKRFRF